MTSQLSIRVQEQTDVAEARRSALAIGRRVELGEQLSDRIALIVTEAATNLLKHAGGGVILLDCFDREQSPCVEMLAIDKGAGMYDIERSFVDGYSTAGSPGNGLGAIARLSSRCDVYSESGQGTVVMAQIHEDPRRRLNLPGQASFEVGAVCLPKHGETACGDGWITHSRPEGLRVVVVDGLGHGLGAADAAAAALELAERYPLDGPVDLIERLHAGLRTTRGAAVAAAEIDTRRGTVRFAGLGNIAGLLFSAEKPRRNMVSYNGTAGHHAAKIQDFTYEWTSDTLMIMHSDGLATHWSLEKYRGLRERHPSVVSAVLFRDFDRGRDDVTVVAARQKPSREAVHDR